MQSFWHPLQYAQFKFYLNAACAGTPTLTSIDAGVVQRLLHLSADFPPGVKHMLLAFSHYFNEVGEMEAQYSAFHTPNAYALAIAQRHPQQFEWIASIHPYQPDSIERLQWAVKNGARAVKWLPAAMGINPNSIKCDRFYQVLAETRLPLLCHSGDEHAVRTPAGDGMNNPLLLRRPLEHGVRVIVAHCASLGHSVDLDRGPSGPPVENLQLFLRLMAEPRYEKLLYGEISAIIQINRGEQVLPILLQHTELHPRLVYGSDYPLPGIMPMVSTERLVDFGLLESGAKGVLQQIRRYNPLLYDFVIKRRLQSQGVRFSDCVFQNRHLFL